jgi:mannopine transport system permease protein
MNEYRMPRLAPNMVMTIAFSAFAWLIVAFLVVPIVLVVPMSFSDSSYLSFPPQGFTFKWYLQVMTDDTWTVPTLLSAQIAVMTALVSTVVGTSAAIAIVRGRFRGKKIVRTLIISPIIAPNIVLAIALYFTFSRFGMIGTRVAFVLSHSLLCIPFVLLTVSASLNRFDPGLELAAMNLGASRWTAFLRVTLPIIRPGIASGAIFSFIISFDEPVISYFLSSVSQSTLPRVMFQNIATSVEPNVAAISTILMMLSLGVLGLTTLLRKGQGALPGR